MAPFLPTVILLGLALQAPADEVARLPLDPDRGLDDAFRTRLTLADPAADSWDSERWSASLHERLDELARLWAQDRLEAGLAEVGWIAPGLEVAPLAPQAEQPALAAGPWTIARADAGAGPPGATLPLARALATWRDAFEGEARLDLEVFEVQAEDELLLSRVRVLAGGTRGAERVQHNAVWTSRWSLAPGGPQLVGLALDSFEAVTLAGRPAGLFADASASLFGQEPVWTRQLDVPLDDWRWRMDARLEPGSLGHHGLALGDVDGDGLEDLYLCQPGGLPNRLLLHQPDDTVRDVSAAAGVDLLDYSSSALLLDLDGDRDLDLVVSTGTALVLFEGDGKARFAERLRLERSLATSLAAADVDDDGDLDLYVCSYLSPYEKDGLPVPYHQAENGEANVLLRNEGGWTFSDATAELGLDANNRRFSFAAAWEDYDDDGDPDLYVANDFGLNNLYRNDGGRFVDVARALGAEDVSAGMGVTWGDVDEDGWSDLYVTNMYTPAACRLTARGGFRPEAAGSERAYRDHAMGNSLLVSRGGRAFEDAAEASGTGFGRWGWGSIFVDLDGDGRLDLFAPNGFSTGERRDDLDSYFWRQVVLRSPERPGQPSEAYAEGWRAVNRLVRQGWSWNGNERNVAWLNLGARRFADVSFATALDLPDDARAAARVDWDGDGDEDLLVTARTAPMLRLLLNQSRERSWIALRLRGERGDAAAVGARVIVTTSGDRRIVRTLRCGEGYLAQSSGTIVVGLGEDEPRAVQVRWAGGETEDFGAPPLRTTCTLEQGSGRAVPAAERAAPSRLVAVAPAAPRAGGSTGSARTVLAVPLGLPRLALETSDGQPASLLGISMQGPQGTGRPLLLVLWGSAWPACTPTLAALAGAAEPLGRAGLQVLALGVDAGPDRERTLTALRAVAWPFSAGFATDEAIQVLEIVDGVLHDSARPLGVPCAFLVGPDGRLVATYQGRLDPRQVVRDLELLELDGQARRDAAAPFAGRWIAAPPGGLEERVAGRLLAHGLERAAAEYRLAQVEVRAFSRARFEVELGQARQAQGRLDEAIDHYRRALEVDPAHFEATRGLAMALHGKGQHALALEVYRRAVVLDPGDALTRANLGLAHLALGDVASARRELDALRTLDAELAERLGQAIEAAGGRR